MAFVSDHPVYDALPISNDALDKGGLELLRAGVVDEELFVTARRIFPEPAHWGWVLADITRRLASLYAADGHHTEAKVSAAIVGAYARSFRRSRKLPLAKARANSRPSTKAAARPKGARTKP